MLLTQNHYHPVNNCPYTYYLSLTLLLLLVVDHTMRFYVTAENWYVNQIEVY